MCLFVFTQKILIKMKFDEKKMKKTTLKKKKSSKLFFPFSGDLWNSSKENSICKQEKKYTLTLIIKLMR